METEFLADIIKEVLVSNGLACLPGFGAFRTEQVSAYFSDKGFTVNPPYLKPVFDAGIKDDTALVDFYAKNNNLPHSRAFDVIAEKITSLRRELMASRAVLLPGLGYLRVTHDGSFFFVAGEDTEIFPFYDMLEPVSLRYLPASMTDSMALSPGILPDAGASENDGAGTAEAPAISVTANSDTAYDAGEKNADSDTDASAEKNADSGPDTAEEKDASDDADASDKKTAFGETDSEKKDPAGKTGSDVSTRRRLHPAVTAFLIIVLLALLALAVLAVLGRTCPEIIDPLLYNAEELRIIHAGL